MILGCIVKRLLRPITDLLAFDPDELDEAIETMIQEAEEAHARSLNR